MAVQELINMAIERCLKGRRTWSEACPDLETFLKGVIDSVLWSKKKSSIRTKTEPDADAGLDSVSDKPSIEDELVAERGRQDICAAFEACVEDDAKLQDLYLAILDGNVKRDAIAEALGWNAEEVSAARTKLRRRLLKRFPKTFGPASKERTS